MSLEEKEPIVLETISEVSKTNYIYMPLFIHVQPEKKQKEKEAKKRKMAEMAENPHYIAAKMREIPPEKRLRRRKDGDFRDVDDMHTAIYYFENGTCAHIHLTDNITNVK